jgi:glucose-6-phosphate isomerase
MTMVSASPAWQALQAHADAVGGTHLRELFAQDPHRFAKLSLRQDDLLVDYSKNRVTEETMRLLFDLARSLDVED